MNFTDLIFLFFILIFLIPLLRLRIQERFRASVTRKIEKKRKTKVINLIGRKEGFSFFAGRVPPFIGIEDWEKVLREIRQIPKNKPIDVVIQTRGGLALAAGQIAKTLASHKGKVTVFVPNYALSGGTLIAIAADVIVMDENAVLGQVDPQLFGLIPAVSVQKVVLSKPQDKLSDQTLLLSDISQKAVKQLEDATFEILLKSNYNRDKAKKIAQHLSRGEYTHDRPFSFEDAKKMGLRVSEKMPKEIYDLLKYY